jgi:hypothetical protein
MNHPLGTFNNSTILDHGISKWPDTDDRDGDTYFWAEVETTETTDDEEVKRTVMIRSNFNEAQEKWTLQTIIDCGFDGDNITELNNGVLVGNLVQVNVYKGKEYKGERKTFTGIKRNNFTFTPEKSTSEAKVVASQFNAMLKKMRKKTDEEPF